MTQAAKFWDRIALKYSRDPIPDENAYQKKLAITREYLNPNMNLLEVGCGTGSTALVHAPYVKHLLATDISAKMLEIAKTKLKSTSIENLDFKQSSIEDLTLTEQSFDGVLGLSVLHLLHDYETAITKIYQSLKPGGIFVSNTACLGDHMWIFKWIGPIGRRLGLLPIIHVFTVAQLKNALLQAGFQIDYEWQPKKNKAVFIVAKKPSK